MERGASKISAYVTHAVFPKESWRDFVDCQPKFENFWITDSLPHAAKLSNSAPFKLLSLCDAIYESLLGLDLQPNL